MNLGLILAILSLDFLKFDLYAYFLLYFFARHSAYINYSSLTKINTVFVLE